MAAAEEVDGVLKAALSKLAKSACWFERLCVGGEVKSAAVMGGCAGGGLVTGAESKLANKASV